MKIEIYCDAGEDGSPIEIANALIRTMVGDKYYNDKTLNQQKIKLAEIAEHIQIYLKFNGGIK